MSAQDIMFFFKLLIAHLLTDFFLQPKSWIDERNAKHFASPKLYFHALIAGISVYLVLADWDNFLPAVFIAVTHFLIDVWKSYRKSNLVIFLIDQLLHIAMLALIWVWLIPDLNDVKSSIHFIVQSKNIWIYAAAYLIATTPLGYLIAFATERWSNQLKDNDGLKEAGKWIGIFERIIILTLIIFSQYEAIGLLIAAKSILRFVESKNNDEVQKKSEYVLIGTLISLGFTLILGIAAKYWLQH